MACTYHTREDARGHARGARPSSWRLERDLDADRAADRKHDAAHDADGERKWRDARAAAGEGRCPVRAPLLGGDVEEIEIDLRPSSNRDAARVRGTAHTHTVHAAQRSECRACAPCARVAGAVGTRRARSSEERTKCCLSLKRWVSWSAVFIDCCRSCGVPRGGGDTARAVRAREGSTCEARGGHPCEARAQWALIPRMLSDVPGARNDGSGSAARAHLGHGRRLVAALVHVGALARHGLHLHLLRVEDLHGRREKASEGEGRPGKATEGDGRRGV